MSSQGGGNDSSVDHGHKNDDVDVDVDVAAAAAVQQKDGKGKEKFIIPSDESDGVWKDGDRLSDLSETSDQSMNEDDEDLETVEEDPFEPVYATPFTDAAGVTIEPVSLDNILPEGSCRRRRRHGN